MAEFSPTDRMKIPKPPMINSLLIKVINERSGSIDRKTFNQKVLTHTIPMFEAFNEDGSRQGYAYELNHTILTFTAAYSSDNLNINFFDSPYSAFVYVKRFVKTAERKEHRAYRIAQRGKGGE